MERTTGEPSDRVSVAVRRVLQLIALFVAIHFLLPLVGGLRSSLDVLTDADPWLVLLAVILQGGSLVAYAQCTRVLLPDDSRIGMLAVLRIQLATLAMTHVLPGGAAASTPLGFRLFRRQGVPAGDAGFVLGLQGAGSSAVLSLLLMVVLAGSVPFRGLRPVYLLACAFGVLLVGCLSVLLVAISIRPTWLTTRWDRLTRRLSDRRQRGLATAQLDLTADVRRLRAHPQMGARAAGWVAAQWVLDCGSLWVFLAAFGAVVAPDKVFVAFGVSNMLAFIPITPGGLGVFEAALTSSLVSFTVPRATVVVAVLAYRLAEFWLPIPIGAIGYATWSPRLRQDRELDAAESGDKGPKS